jgi:DNA-binding beta-propeller fold protein YncE
LTVDNLAYEVVDGWGELPEGWVYTQVPGVAVDNHDMVYAFNRGLHPVIVYDWEGKFLGSWGEGVFKTPHGIYVDSNDNVFCVDSGDHTVRKFDVGGRLLLKLGSEGELGGVGKPFNRPTDAAVSSTGDIFVTDGYGNSRVHRFTSKGELLLSWGEPGDGPGQFNIPHGVWVDRDDRVWVADRQNNRLQIFTEEGGYLDEWTGFSLPCTVYIDKLDRVYVSELRSRVSVLSIEGELLARWGGEKSATPGEFVAPHCAWADSHGDLYVGEALEGQRIQKFTLRKSEY